MSTEPNIEKEKLVKDMLADVSKQPEALKPIFAKMIKVKDSVAQVDKTIGDAQTSLETLFQSRERMLGAWSVLLETVTEMLPEETKIV